MTLFSIIVGLMALATWWLVARPLLTPREPGDEMNQEVRQLRRQLVQLEELHQTGTLAREQYELSRQVVERRIVDAVMSEPGAAVAVRPARRLALALGVFIAVVAAGGYWLVGSRTGFGIAPGAMTAGAGGEATAEGAPAGEQHALSSEQIATLAQKLADRLKERPDDAQGWSMLARSYVVLGRYGEAVDAYKRSVELVGDDAQLLADYADALAMAGGRSLEGEPMKLVQRALEADPNNLKALSLAGTAAFEKKDYANAVKYWEQVAQVDSADNELVQQVRGGIAEARELAAKSGVKLPPPSIPAAVAAAPTGAAANVGAVSGRVSLAPALAKQVSPDDTVFIFARAATGPRMPLAIVRRQVRDLPVDFSLDDSMAMTPDMKLSKFPQVVVGARVSKSGDAVAGPGDLQGLTQAIALGTTGLEIEINQAVK